MNMIKKILLGLIVLPITVLADDSEVHLDVLGDDAEIMIEQQDTDNMIDLNFSNSDDLNLKIYQFGGENTVKMKGVNSYINNADNLNINITQFQNANNISENQILFDELTGNNNNLRLGQGVHLDDSSDTTFATDNWEGGGHYIEIDLYGNNNNIAGYQKNNGNGAHTMNLHLAGSNNDVWWYQKQDGGKTLNLTIYNSDNDVNITQRGNHDTHTANITLDGTYGTDFTLHQKATSGAAFNYTISQNCVTLGGCTVSVTQE